MNLHWQKHHIHDMQNVQSIKIIRPLCWCFRFFSKSQTASGCKCKPWTPTGSCKAQTSGSTKSWAAPWSPLCTLQHGRERRPVPLARCPGRSFVHFSIPKMVGKWVAAASMVICLIYFYYIFIYIYIYNLYNYICLVCSTCSLLRPRLWRSFWVQRVKAFEVGYIWIFIVFCTQCAYKFLWINGNLQPLCWGLVLCNFGMASFHSDSPVHASELWR